MRQAVTEGTAAGLNIPSVEVAAKTGTAELGTQKKLVNSWSVGFFPYKNPHYAFAVLMERGPSQNQIGATYVMRQFLDWLSIYKPEYLKED
jgi:penicillin-binding protein 2